MRSTVYVGGFAKNTSEKELNELLAGIAENASEEELKELFVPIAPNASEEELQKLRKLEMHVKKNGKRYALVNCATEDLASKAIRVLNKKKDLKGNMIVVSFAHAQVIDDFPPYTIGRNGSEGYTDFILRLREKFANHSCGPRKHILEVPVLPEQQCQKQPDRWIHIKLIAEGKDEEPSTITLVIRDDNLYVKGFMNQVGKWFELCGQDDMREEMLPPKPYNATELKCWGFMYPGLMNLSDRQQVQKTLKSTRLGKAFAEKAVRKLSAYEYDPKDEKNDLPVRLRLAGLIMMICEAARMDPFLNNFADNWNKEKGLEPKLSGFIWKWGNMSAALLKWRECRFWNKSCGVESFNDALKDVQLVLESDNINGHGGAHVEILNVSANFEVHRINVIDEAQHEHRIYINPKCWKNPGDANKKLEDKGKKTEDGEKKMVRLEVIVRDDGKGKPTGISGYAWFEVEINFPRSLGVGDSIEMRWDCHKLLDRDATHQLVTRVVDLGHNNRIDFNYLVLSNAVEAIVEVKLRHKDEDPPNDDDVKAETKKYSAHGVITAHIDGLEPHQIDDFEPHQIVLFSIPDPEKPIPMESSILRLARSAIKVPPHGKPLQIDMTGLHITESFSNRKRVMKKPDSISFDFGDPIPKYKNDSGREVDVSVTWKPEQKEIKLEPAGEVDFSLVDFDESINTLRKVIAKGKDVIFNGHPVLKLSSGIKQCIHILFQVVNGKETSPMTLAVWGDICYRVGFMNESGIWYDLGNGHGANALPPQYNSVLLDWGVSYKDILGMSNWLEAAEVLKSTLLGKVFAEKAVRMLLRYPDVEDGENPRLALAGLIIMACESARFNVVRKDFKEGWDTGKGLSWRLMNYIWSWGRISRALLDYWPEEDERMTDEMEIYGPEDALRDVYLVFRSHTKAVPPEIVQE